MNEGSFEIIEGIKCFSPKLAYGNGGFDKDSFEKLYHIESRNFWFKARNNLVLFLAKKYFSRERKVRFMEIGCGTGFVLRGMTILRNFELIGSEIYIQGLRFARIRNQKIHFIQMDAREIPFSDEFDGIGAFDVLEHIEEDTKVIQAVYRALKPGGKFFMSVPQHQFLWSQVDVNAHHQRRYSRIDLHRKLTSVGFKIVFNSSFVFFLFPIMLLSRLLKRKKVNTLSELEMPWTMNSIFYLFTMMDIFLIKLGLSLPFGGSLFCIAVKEKVS